MPIVDPQIPVLINHKDGTVHRRCVCQCGKVLYKKNVTLGEYTITEENYKRLLLPGGDQGEYSFLCDCGINHLVFQIDETIRIGEDTDDDVDNTTLQNA